MAVMRECNLRALKRHNKEVDSFAWFYKAEWTLDQINTQRRIIQDLIDYIGELPLP